MWKKAFSPEIGYHTVSYKESILDGLKSWKESDESFIGLVLFPSFLSCP